MGPQEKLGLYFIAGAGCPKGSNTSKSVSSMRGRRHSTALIKECERQTVHPSATQALYMTEWGRTTVGRRAELLSRVLTNKILLRSLCWACQGMGDAGHGCCRGMGAARGWVPPCPPRWDCRFGRRVFLINAGSHRLTTDVLQNSPLWRVCITTSYSGVAASAQNVFGIFVLE